MTHPDGRPLLALLTTLLAAGCVEHRAVLLPPPDRPEPAPQLVLPGHPPAALTEPVIAAGSLPQALHASAWRRRPDGALERAEVHVRSPLPWWQRFPADLFSDLLLPARFTVAAEVEVMTDVVEPVAIEELDRRARQRGYSGELDRSGRE